MQIQEEFLKKHDYYSVISLLLQNGEQVRMNLYGYCMSPLVKDGENVTITPIKPEKLKCGDIVVYRNGDRFKIHRFLRFVNIKNTTFIITKGDRAINQDPPVPLHLLLGKVKMIHREDKTIDLESPFWENLNYIMGKVSPYRSNVKFILLFPRRCASQLFRLVVGTNYRTWKKRKGIQNK